MQPESKRFLRFLGSWVINTAAVALTVIILRGHISYGDKASNLIITSLLLGILNAFVRPLLMFLALPFLIFTLGLFTLVINALILSLLTLLLPFFHITGSDGHFSFGYAFLGAILISFIAIILNVLTGNTGNSRITVRRGPPPPPPSNKDGGNGPVIDV